MKMIKDYQIIKKLGRGTYGDVYQVQKKNTNDIYVIKQISLCGLKQKEFDLVNQEAKLLSLIDSDFVVKYYDFFEEEDIIYIVMEFCERGDLENFLEQKKKSVKFLDEDLIWQIFLKITIGLADIHKKKILHRDIKLKNIFLKNNLDIKIGDLGVGKFLSDKSNATTILGTPDYYSPEMIRRIPYNDKIDIWCLGCALYKLCTFKLPFQEKDFEERINKILRSDPAPIDSHYSQELRDLLFKLLSKKPEDRPSCKEILNNEKVLKKAKEFGLDKYIIKMNDNSMNKVNKNNEINEKINRTFFNVIQINPNNIRNIQNFGSKITDFNDFGEIKFENYSVVKKMQSKEDGLFYSIKIIPKYSSFIDNKNTYREKTIQRMVNNENIFRFYDSFEDESNHYLVFEYFPYNTLEEKIQKHMEFTAELIKEEKIINIFKQILNGIEYLHSKNVIHRYIRPDNILIDEFGKVKITNFCFAAYIKSDLENQNFDRKLCLNNSYILNKDYGAPEIINHNNYDFKSDIYSLGLIIFNLMTWRLPFNSIIINENEIARLPINTSISNKYSKDLKKLVYRMISEKPFERPTAKEAKEILVKIEKLNNNINNNLNKKESLYKNINSNNDISSLISIISCLCEIDELHLGLIKSLILHYYKNKETLEYFLPNSLLGLGEIIKKNKNNKLKNFSESYGVKKSQFYECFCEFKNLLSKKTEKNQLIDDNNPIFILQEIIKIFSKEFKENIKYHNDLFKIPDLIIKEDLLKSKIKEFINNFESDYASPFVDLFYFINIIIIKCQFCGGIIDFNNKILFSLSIHTFKDYNLIRIINCNINASILNKEYLCPYCGSLDLKEEKLFLNSPQYLIIEFENKNNIILNDTINLSPYILTNVGPKKYDLFAVINEENMNNQKHYILAVKKDKNNYLLYSDNNCQKVEGDIKKYSNLCIAIYKGQREF